MLIDMLMRIEPSARVFTIDTGVLFPETYEVWRKVEDRYGLRVEVVDATPPNGTPWSASNCCGARKVDALERALAGTRRLDHRHPARAVAHARERRGDRVGRAARRLEVQSARGLDGPGRVELRQRARSALPSPHDQGLRVDRLRPLHASRQRPRGPLGRAGQDRVRSARMTDAPVPPGRLDLRDLTPPRPRVRGDPRDPRGRGGARARRAAVLRRQGLRRAAAPGRARRSARAACRSRSCTWTPATTSPR